MVGAELGGAVGDTYDCQRGGVVDLQCVCRPIETFDNLAAGFAECGQFGICVFGSGGGVGHKSEFGNTASGHGVGELFECRFRVDAADTFPAWTANFGVVSGRWPCAREAAFEQGGDVFCGDCDCGDYRADLVVSRRYHSEMMDVVLLGDRNPEFLTHRELDAALGLFPAHVRGRWVGTDSREAAEVSNADGLWVVSGSPYRDDDAVYAAIEQARMSGQPFLGTCSGFQYAVVEFARHVAGISDASHAETAPDAGERVIERLSCSLVGQERKVRAVAGTKLYELMGPKPFVGFHWCNFGVAGGYVERLQQHGLTISAYGDDAGAEALEIDGHPFFVATLFQPQVGASSGKDLHPLIAAFVRAVGG